MEPNKPLVSEFMEPHEIVWLADRPDRDSLGVRIEEFWYSIYVEELGKNPSQADHVRKRLPDPYLDSGGMFIALSASGEVVGTVLVATNEAIGDFYRNLYQIPWSSTATGPNVSICNKLIVKKTWRQKSGLALDLCQAIFAWGLRHEIRFNYIHCAAYLQTYYERIGWREHIGWINHPDYGERYTMVLDLHDLEHLTEVRSPFAKIYAAARDQNLGTSIPVRRA